MASCTISHSRRGRSGALVFLNTAHGVVQVPWTILGEVVGLAQRKPEVVLLRQGAGVARHCGGADSVVDEIVNQQ